MKCLVYISIFVSSLAASEALLSQDHPLWSYRTNDEIVVIQDQPIQGKIVVAIGDYLPEVFEKSAIEGVDLENRFQVFYGSPPLTERLEFVYDHKKYGFRVSPTILVSVDSHSDNMKPFEELPLSEMRVQAIYILKTPLYLEFEGAVNEVRAWDSMFRKMSFEKSCYTALQTIQEARVRSELEIKGNRFPFYYVSAWKKDGVRYTIGIARSENQHKTTKYAYNIQLVIKEIASIDINVWRELDNCS